MHSDTGFTVQWLLSKPADTRQTTANMIKHSQWAVAVLTTGIDIDHMYFIYQPIHIVPHHSHKPQISAIQPDQLTIPTLLHWARQWFTGGLQHAILICCIWMLKYITSVQIGNYCYDTTYIYVAWYARAITACFMSLLYHTSASPRTTVRYKGGW